MKPRILIATANVTRLVDLVYSDFIKEIKKNYEIEFLIEKKKKKESDNYKLDYIEEIENENIRYDSNQSNFFIKLKNKVYEILHYTNQIKHYLKINRYNSVKNTVLNTCAIDNPRYIVFFRIVCFLKLLFFLKIFLSVTKKLLLLFIKKRIDKKYDLILVPFKVDPYNSFEVDVIEEAKKKNIISYGIQLNWDNIPSRYTEFIPEFISVLGEQSFTYLFATYSITPKRIFVNGSLKIESHQKVKFKNKADSRNILGLPQDKKIICFAPSGEEFDEIFILRTLEKLKLKKKINDNFIFYVKGYKSGKNQTITDALWNEYRKIPKENDFIFKNVIFWDPAKLELNEKDFFVHFFSSIDGLISTYSSICLEAANHGIPCMGLNYNSRDYGLLVRDNWVHKNYWPHSYSFRNNKFIKDVEVQSREEIEDKILKFADSVENAELYSLFKNISNLNISNFSEQSVKSKIIESIDLVINRPEDLEDSDKVF